MTGQQKRIEDEFPFLKVSKSTMNAKDLKILFTKRLKLAVTPDFSKKSDCANKLLSLRKKYPFNILHHNK